MREEYQISEKDDIVADEKAIYEKIKPIIICCLHNINVHNENLISFRQYINQKGYGYSSVLICDNLLLRIRYRKKSKYLSVNQRYYREFEDILPKDCETKYFESDPKFMRIILNDKDQITMFSDFIENCTKQLLKDMPTSFGCCSRYEECSNAKQCVNTNEELILGCSYRRNIEKGIFFYGDNSINSNS